MAIENKDDFIKLLDDLIEIGIFVFNKRKDGYYKDDFFKNFSPKSELSIELII